MVKKLTKKEEEEFFKQNVTKFSISYLLGKLVGWGVVVLLLLGIAAAIKALWVFVFL